MWQLAKAIADLVVGLALGSSPARSRRWCVGENGTCGGIILGLALVRLFVAAGSAR